MNRLRFGVALAVVGLLVTAAAAGADVKSTSKSQTKFEGMLGRMMGMFGGKAAKEGVVTTVAVKGDRKITTTGDTAEIVDLAEEKVYELNLKDKILQGRHLRRDAEADGGSARQGGSGSAQAARGRRQEGPEREGNGDRIQRQGDGPAAADQRLRLAGRSS